jgi:hypothetical protein
MRVGHSLRCHWSSATWHTGADRLGAKDHSQGDYVDNMYITEEGVARESPVCTLALRPCMQVAAEWENESASNVNRAARDVSALLLHMLPNLGSFLKRLPAVGFPALRCPERFHLKEGILHRTLCWGEIQDYKMWCDKMATERCI